MGGKNSTPSINRDVGHWREHEVVQLRVVERLGFREIADRLDCRVATAHEAWTRAMDRAAEEAKKQLNHLIGEQLATIAAVIDHMMPKVRAGDTRAAEVVLKALERQSKLTGADAPVKVNAEITDKLTAEIMALADEIAEAAAQESST